MSPAVSYYVGPPDGGSHEAGDLLELLDDAMFSAIAGDATALTAARVLWKQALGALSADLVDESREHYLRFAVDVTRQVDGEELRDPMKAVTAVEVIELLTRA